MPIAFSFDPSICPRKPTHVFNPCGHVASKQTCEQWARTPVFNKNIAIPTLCRICPFCATELVGSNALPESGPDGREAAAVGAFSKLVLQTETGQEWESDAGEESATSSPMRYEKAESHSNCSLEDVIESQKKLFLKESVSGSSHQQLGFWFGPGQGGESSSVETDELLARLSQERLIQMKFPKFAPGYTIFGERK